jgi:hypothetical protein
VSLLVMPDGALLVSDDGGGRIWRVSASVTVGGGGNPPPSGDLDVTAATTGTNRPASYTAVLDGGAMQQTVGANGTVRFTGLATGDHTALLDGVPANCSVSGANPRTVTVSAGAVSGTTFSVNCTGGQAPSTGDVDLTTATTGTQLDPDDYLSILDGSTERVIRINETIRFSGLAPGAHTVMLDGVAASCTVSGANPRSVTVVAGAVTGTTFSVSCGGGQSGSTGNLDVTTGTTGTNLDSDDYLSVLDGTQETVVGINQTVRMTGLTAGSHTIALDGVAANCTVTAPNPRTVTIAAGATTGTTFSVRCL